jgi:hypothetical protein
MNRKSFIHALLVAPFAGFGGKKLWPWKMNRSFVPPVNPAWVDAPYEIEWGTTAHDGASLISYCPIVGIKRTPRRYYRV